MMWQRVRTSKNVWKLVLTVGYGCSVLKTRSATRNRLEIVRDEQLQLDLGVSTLKQVVGLDNGSRRSTMGVNSCKMVKMAVIQ